MIKKKIVIAEDNSVLSLLLKFRLEKYGYHLFIAKNGKEAIEFIKNEEPDIILTDVMMDIVTGLDVIKYVRLELKSETPILVFSFSGQEEMVLNAYNLGASDNMKKPLNPFQLLIRVKRMLF